MTAPTAAELETLMTLADAATSGPWVVEAARIWSGEPNPNKTELLIFRGTYEWARDAVLHHPTT